jgi:hypothetical protein
VHDLQRLHFVTERYPHLQGLRLVPLGLPFLLSAAWRAGQLSWVPGTSGSGAGLWFLGLLLVGLMCAVALGTYYRERFGSVQPVRTFTGPLAALLFAGVFLFSLWTQDTLSPSISLPAAAVGLGLGCLAVVGGQVRTHYLALAALCVAFATLGSLGVSFHARDLLFDDLVGIGLIVAGIGDHRLLRRTLAPVSHGQAI